MKKERKIQNICGFSRAAPLNRTVAKAIDIIFVLILALILNPIGPIAAVFYSLFADGFNGRSIGKRLVGLQVLNIRNERSIGFKESVVRNIPLGVFIIFAINPFLWILLLVLGIPLLILELYLYWVLASSNRIGDILADTAVIQTKAGVILNNKNPKSKTAS